MRCSRSRERSSTPPRAPGAAASPGRSTASQAAASGTGTITSGGVYTPPSTVGTHTITADRRSPRRRASPSTSPTTPARSRSTTTTCATGQNLNETVLTPANVNSTTFGKLFSYPLDGLTFASPLYVAERRTSRARASTTSSTSRPSTTASTRSTPTAEAARRSGRTPSSTRPPASRRSRRRTPARPSDIPNEIGITGTPVIDPSTNTLYVVAATKEVTGGTTKYVNRLHALDLTTGAEKLGGPVVIARERPRHRRRRVNGTISFNNITENQRPALLLANGEVYVGFANHGNNPPYHGWVMAYNATTLHQDWVFCTTPNAGSGGIWMGGDGIGADSAGLALLLDRQRHVTTELERRRNDYGDSLLKLSPSGTRHRLLHAVQLRRPRQRRHRPRARAGSCCCPTSRAPIRTR